MALAILLSCTALLARRARCEHVGLPVGLSTHQIAHWRPSGGVEQAGDASAAVNTDARGGLRRAGPGPLHTQPLRQSSDPKAMMPVQQVPWKSIYLAGGLLIAGAPLCLLPWRLP